ncbi:Astacin-like metalloendopeptidase [Aphelenchoides besseyi]|nr:Astacin-like metalloendopeptidase [Aphelenchoides besseyi]
MSWFQFFWLLFLNCNAQDFLSLITPFVGSGLGTPTGGASAFGSALGPSESTGNAAAGGPTSVISSMFGPQPGEEFGNNPFGDFINLGQAIAQPQPRQKSQRRRRSRQFSRRDDSSMKSLRRRKPKILASKDRRPAVVPPPSRFRPRVKRQANPLELISTVPKRSGAGSGKLIDNFGRNFFSFLDELHEYSQLQPDPLLQTTTVEAPTLFPTLLPPFPSPIAPVTGLFSSTTAPALAAQQSYSDPYIFPSAGTSLIANDFGAHTPQTADLLDANNLMRGFLRSMARAAGTVRQLIFLFNIFSASAAASGTKRWDRSGKKSTVDGSVVRVGYFAHIQANESVSPRLSTHDFAFRIVVAEAEKQRRRVKRKVITGGVYRWPKGVPISFSFRDSDKEWRQLIREGLKLWERETCIRFKESSNAKDRLEFIRGGGCYSSVGKVGGNQKISIGFGCEDVGHALGFWHEQSRPDRDKYIRLNEKYIAGGTDGNFAKRSDLEADGMGLPYDLGSVMHYGPTAFTLDWDENTIVTKDPKYQHTIGQRSGPSFIDIQCYNGGYADPNNCQRCKCPPGLGGKSCSQVEQSATAIGCGGELQAQPFWQHLTFKGRNRCVWRIRAANARIRVILDKSSYQCESTCKSFVEIKHNSDFQQVGFRS